MDWTKAAWDTDKSVLRNLADWMLASIIGFIIVCMLFFGFGCAATTATPEQDRTELRVPIFGGGIERDRTYPQPAAPDPLPTGIDAAIKQADLMSAQGNVVIEAEDLERKQQEKNAVDRMERSRRYAEAQDCERRLNVDSSLDGEALTARKCDCWKNAKITDSFAASQMCDFERLEVPDEPPAVPPPDEPPPPLVPPPERPRTPGAGERRKDQFLGMAERLAPNAFADASQGCRNAMADALVVLEGNPAFDDHSTANLLSWVALGRLPPTPVGLEDVYAQIYVEGCP